MPRLALLISLVAAAAHAAPPELEPLDPSAWNVQRAAHLLERTGFGAMPHEIVALASMPFDEAVEHVLAFRKRPAGKRFVAQPFDPRSERNRQLRLRATNGYRGQIRREATEALKRLLERAMRGKKDAERAMPPRTTVEGLERRLVAGVRLTQAELDRILKDRVERALRGLHRYRLHAQLRNWWLARMVEGRRPLEDKLTLFWHGHFTSSAAKVLDGEHMIRQHVTFRRHAAGNFAAMLRAIAVDPAMLIYLDGVDSHKRRPNENWSRELLELFTLGIGHYTERDVAEAARAFTGWTWDERPRNNPWLQHRTMRYVAAHHDEGEKTFLGKTGRWKGKDVIRILLAHPQTAKWICAKLCRFFLGRDAPQPVVDSLADTLRGSDYELRPVLARLFRSRLFHDKATIGARIKQPMELIVGTLRHLGVRPTDLPEDAQDRRMHALDDIGRRLGQRLLHPATVEGWPEGREWINAATTLMRQNVVTAVAEQPVQIRGRPIQMRILRPEHLRLFTELRRFEDPAMLVDHLLARLLRRKLPAARRAKLLAVVAPAGRYDPARIRDVVLLITSMPEYQLN